jgi:hypothetical protein
MNAPNDVNGPNPKDLAGRCKPDTSLVTGVMMAHLADALTDGAAKYGVANWRDIKVQARTYCSAADRHTRAWLDGEEVASDSLVHHLAHAAASLLILLDAQVHGSMIDNRQTPGSSARVFAELAHARANRKQTK